MLATENLAFDMAICVDVMPLDGAPVMADLNPSVPVSSNKQLIVLGVNKYVQC